MVSRREKGKAERKGRILDAARAMIRESGDVGLSMRALAERADVSLMTLYNLLGSRQAVLLEVLSQDIATSNRAYAELQFSDPLEALFGVVPLIRQQIEANGSFWSVVVLSLFQKGSEEVRAAVRDNSWKHWHRVLTEARDQGYLRRSIDVESILLMFDNIFYANSFSLACGDIDIELFEARAQFGFAMVLAAAVSRPYLLRVRALVADLQARLQELEQREAQMLRALAS